MVTLVPPWVKLMEPFIVPSGVQQDVTNFVKVEAYTFNAQYWLVLYELELYTTQFAEDEDASKAHVAVDLLDI